MLGSGKEESARILALKKLIVCTLETDTKKKQLEDNVSVLEQSHKPSVSGIHRKDL